MNRAIVRVCAVAIALGLLVSETDGLAEPYPIRTSISTADVEGIARLQTGTWRISLRPQTANPPRLWIDVVPTGVPPELAGTVDPDWFNGPAPKPDAAIRFYAADVSENRLIAAVEVFSTGLSAKPWYVRRYFDLGAKRRDPMASESADETLYSLSGRVLSHYNAASGTHEYLWIRDRLDSALGYYKSDEIARDRFAREGGQVFAPRLAEVQRVVRAHGDEDALIKGVPFMPMTPKDGYVGALPVFPLAIYLLPKAGKPMLVFQQ